MWKILELPKIPTFADLPNEVMAEILDNLERNDLFKLTRINKRYHGLIQYILEHKKKIRFCGDHSRVLILALPTKFDAISLDHEKPSVATYSTFFNDAPTTSSNLLINTQKRAVSRSFINGGKERTITFIEGPTVNNKRMDLYLLAVKADLLLFVVDPEEIDTHTDAIKEPIFGCCFMMSARNVIVAVDLSNVSANEDKGPNPLLTVFNQAKIKISKLLDRTVGMCYTITPINLRTGTNITSNITPKYEWFSGASLKKLVLDDQLRTNFDSSSFKKLCEAPFKLQLTGAYRIHHGTIAIGTGRIISGTLTKRQAMYFHPGSIYGNVQSIYSFDKTLNTAYPGDIIGVNLGDFLSNELNPRYGYAVNHIGTPKVNCTLAFRAQIVVMKSDRFVQHQTYRVFFGSSRVSCILWWIFPASGDREISETNRKFKVQKPKKEEFKKKKAQYRIKLKEYKQQVKEMKLEFQSKVSERPPRKQYKKVTAILLPLVHYDIEPYKPSEFEKNYTGKLMMVEKGKIIGVGRVDRVISNAEKSFASIYCRNASKRHYKEVVARSESLFALPKEKKIHQLFLNHVTSNEHAKNCIEKRQCIVW